MAQRVSLAQLGGFITQNMDRIKTVRQEAEELQVGFNSKYVEFKARHDATLASLVNRIAEKTGTRQVLVKAVVQQFFDGIICELAEGNRLEFRDFGVFDTKTSAPRTAQNPKTLERVQVPAKHRVVFKAGRLMKEGVNGRRDPSGPAAPSGVPGQQGGVSAAIGAQ